MANCHSEFQDFYNAITLSSTKKDYLKSGRKGVREKIKKHFKDSLEVKVPKFHGQGSYAMSTIVNPIDSEFDIDDGVYLQHFADNQNEWPTSETVHGWVYKAIENHTSEKPVDKKKCVRVVYKGDYHVDLPIYCMCADIPYLAVKGVGWIASDPRALTNWFLDEVKTKTDQLRKVVRYLKAWADDQSCKMPSGLILTVLAANHFSSSTRDDVSFVSTVKAIYNQLRFSEIIYNPVDSTERLSDRIAEAQMKSFKEKLEKLIERADDALTQDNSTEAYKGWNKVFGSRFVVPGDKKSNRITYPVAGTSRPKPWGLLLSLLGGALLILGFKSR
ncbi:MAG TPA: hypothetical protein VGK02_09285 [Candidatus Aquicultor sp.]|jgi:hypothetical protein